MKIEDILHQATSQAVQKKGKPVESREGDFQQLLEDAEARLPESGRPLNLASSIVGPAAEPALIAASINASKRDDVSRVRSEGIKATENALGILEQYQKALGDPRKTLRQVEPLVQSLTQQTEHLNLLAGKISAADPLKRIVTELGIISTVEIEKFDRGEYV